jgi:hypothetical protein
LHKPSILPNPVLIHGVLRKSGRGCPPCIGQEEKQRRAADQARGTVKAAVLKGDSRSSDLIVASCYDQKPYYMISHSCESVTWTPITKKVWSSTQKTMVDFSFLRLNLSDDYNFEMNNNDIADQLRLVYRIMRFQRNNKWWWALFLWGYEVSLVNSYVSYKHYCELKGVPVKWTHHNWNEAIGYVHVNPEEYWPRKKSPPKSGVDRVTEGKKRAPKIDSLALSPTRGRLRGRLDDSLTHMPVYPDAPTGMTVCQLH